ncbi:glycosyltransferase family 9 protein [Fulvivirga sp. 29W222]|uniref:Glycosyltransferase family 9 protein n=1 Tax=Fulvivirga marina TaxID=2494733 RepID=A0A937KE82_9BACT|nr:glycosyltransferase family 9 protein [Fulvivirga marina]MBL6449299.1 glycosyltransferase family 9 protein [Fulvivirga marina]
MNWEDVKRDCLYYKGHIPCLPNKQNGHVCSSCKAYSKISKRILIIKLGAIGDVIRTTPLLQKYKKLYPGCHITWISDYTEVLPKSWIDHIIPMTSRKMMEVSYTQYDIAVNLDKEPEACILLKQVTAHEKYGFTWENGIAPATRAAKAKLLTGLFDELSKQNKASYIQEIFSICHLEYSDERYILDIDPVHHSQWKEKLQNETSLPVIGLNTGAGQRWPTRQWPLEYWESLIRTLQDKGYFCVLLGGKDEHENNTRLNEKTGAWYPGNFPVQQFIALIAQCDLIVSQVTMAMHLCLALNRKLVLMNNIFNPYEFDLFDQGEIIQPEKACECYFGASCVYGESCMKYITPESIADAVERQLPVKQGNMEPNYSLKYDF